jgi:hypothetical protein
MHFWAQIEIDVETALVAKKVLEANPQAGWAEINNTRVEARKRITKARRDAMNSWLPVCNPEFAEIICIVTQFEQAEYGKTKLTKNNILSKSAARSLRRAS